MLLALLLALHQPRSAPEPASPLLYQAARAIHGAHQPLQRLYLFLLLPLLLTQSPLQVAVPIRHLSL